MGSQWGAHDECLGGKGRVAGCSRGHGFEQEEQSSLHLSAPDLPLVVQGCWWLLMGLEGGHEKKEEGHPEAGSVPTSTN